MIKNVFYLITIFLAINCSDQTGQDLMTNVPAIEINDKHLVKVIGNDPLTPFQWYLKNTGEDIYRYRRFKMGEDINWDYDSLDKGEGVNVVISDGRIQLDHEDLIENSNFQLSRNYSIDGDPYGVNPNTGKSDDNHGTFIAGLIGAVSDNSLGITGVAPNSTVVGYNYIDSTQSLSITLDNYEAPERSIFNYSYGFHNCEVSPAPESEVNQIRTQSMKGHIYVTAAGNDFVEGQDLCGGDKDHKFLGNAIYNEFKNFPEVFVVGAVNGLGMPASYSTPGPNLLVSAPGGDISSPIVGLDIEGCDEGEATTNSNYNFENGEDELNQNCNYIMHSMLGTSFAAPLVSGVVAQLLSICDECDFRDIRHALILTAAHRDDLNWVYAHPLSLGLNGHPYHLGFVKNSYGLEFNNDVGFGVVDSTRVLDYLKQGRENLFDRRESISHDGSIFYQSGILDLPIPDANNNGLRTFINVDSHNLTIEHILLKVTLSHTYLSDIGIDLISPAGTRHRLTYINNEVLMSGEHTLLIGVNGFYGEKSFGEWRLEFVDGLKNDTGRIISWEMKFMGGKWGTDFNQSSNMVVQLELVDGQFSWPSSIDGNENIIRHEICVKPQGQDCNDLDWRSLHKNQSSFRPQYYYHSSEQSKLIEGEVYDFSIRKIGFDEEESLITTVSWEYSK